MDSKWAHRRHILRFLLLAILFGGEAYFYEHPKVSGLNTLLLNSMYNFSDGHYLTFFYKMTQFGSTPTYIIMIILVMIGLGFNKHILGVVFVPSSVIGSVLLNYVLKNWFQKPRPDVAHLAHATSFSYPSGHSMNALVFFFFLAFLSHEFFKHKVSRLIIWLVAAVIVLLIGCSRVYLGVHYPLDVFGGYLAGGSWVSLVLYIYCKLNPYRNVHLT